MAGMKWLYFEEVVLLWLMGLVVGCKFAGIDGKEIIAKSIADAHQHVGIDWRFVENLVNVGAAVIEPMSEPSHRNALLADLLMYQFTDVNHNNRSSLTHHKKTPVHSIYTDCYTFCGTAPASTPPIAGIKQKKTWESVLLLIPVPGSRIATHKDKQRSQPTPRCIYTKHHAATWCHSIMAAHNDAMQRI